MAEKINKFGKIRYIEPNDFLEDKTNNITHPQEDYSIYVDLLVRSVDRKGRAKNDNYEISLGGSQKEKSSFFYGENGFFNDTPSFTTYKDIMSGEVGSTNESLGITNIHITYNSYFYPEVTINFTDIRGAALMMPHEENYRQEQINNAKGEPVYSNTVQSFFTSLFSFPYPEFILRVKGFYGKMIEYSLLVSDFKSSFNNDNGNFDVTLKLIGRMYGVYTDIPMSYLMIAPYCRYGSSNDRTIWENKNFLLDNKRMPTFIELREEIINANSQLSEYIDSNMSNNYKKITDERNGLQELLSYYMNVKETLIQTSDVYYDEHIFYISKSALTELNKTSFNSIQINPFIISLLNHINKYPQTVSSIKKLEKNHFINEDTLDNIIFNFNNDKISNNRNLKTGRRFENDFIKKEFKEKNTKQAFFYYLDCKDFYNTLNKSLERTKEEINKIEEDIKKNQNETLFKIFGFYPTLKNIFKILMAHLETFVEIYVSFLNKVSYNNTRKLSDYNFSTYLCDINNEEKEIPPFPGFRDLNKYEFCYPTSDILNGKEIEENILVEDILESISEFKKITNRVNTVNNNDNELHLIPTCLSDFVNRINPYQLLRKDNRYTPEWFMTFFGIRCITHFLLEKRDQQIKPENFGALEAYNFWVQNKDLNERIFLYIKTTEFCPENFISFLLNRQKDDDGNINPYYNSGKPCYEYKKLKSLLTLTKKKDISINKEIGFPMVIDRTNTLTFFNDIDSDYKYSFKKDTPTTGARPYGFMQTVSEDILKKIDTQLSGVDLSNYVSNSGITKNIVNNYLSNTSEFFIERKDIEKNSAHYDSVMGCAKINKSGILYYNRKESNTFFQEVNIDAYENKLGGKFTLTDYFGSNFTEGKLVSIINSSDENIFFQSNLTSEDFLMSIPYNFESIYNSLTSGVKIITLPYCFKLFIGMVLSKLNGISDKESFFKEIKSIIIRYSEIHKYNWDNNRIIFFYSLILKLCSLLTRKTDGTFNIFKTKYIATAPYVGERFTMFVNEKWDVHKNNSLPEEIYEKNELPDFSNDFLNLKTSYQDWATSDKPGSFNYFKRAYTLERLSDTYAETILDDKYKGNIITFTTNIISGQTDEEYKEKYNNGWYPKWDKYTGTDFTDRYSNVYLICEKNEKRYPYLSFNEGFYAYQELSNFFKKTDKLVIPYPLIETYDTTSGVTVFTQAFSSFKKKLIDLYEPNFKSLKEQTEKISVDVDNDNKLAIYKTLKNLQDKHFANLLKEKDKFILKEKYEDVDNVSEFNRFSFIDTFYRDISNELCVNLDVLNEILTIISNGETPTSTETTLSSDMSVYSFMSLLCQKHNLLFLSIPSFSGVFNRENGEDNLTKMFTPIPFKESFNSNILKGPNYICFYPHQPSQHLDIPSSDYRNDGFNICDINETGSFEGSSDVKFLFNDEDDDNIIAPAFGVEYGSQKQSIFKSVNINMDNPQTTEVAVANQFALVNGVSNEPRNLIFQGQDLFKIYSNYSYTCNVTMMGCAQIQPLMYFQLNNIPMFRGAYQIINVEHNITPGDMTTSFKGVRINRTKMPIVKNCFNISHLSSTDDVNVIKTNKELNEILLTDADFASTNFGLADIKELNINTTSFTENNLDKYISFAPGKEEAFNNLNPSLRRLIYCIVNDVKVWNEEEEKSSDIISIYITSATRDGNDSSDHSINGTPSVRRKQLKGTDVNGNIKLYSEMGCAVDFYALKNGKVDKGETSIKLFAKIASNYSNCIRQLIWECANGKSSTLNEISNCIHLASYGNENDNDKHEIFVGTHPNFTSVNINEIPSCFVDIIRNINNNKEKGSLLMCNNFNEINNKIYKGLTSNVIECDRNDLNKLYNEQLLLS